MVGIIEATRNVGDRASTVVILLALSAHIATPPPETVFELVGEHYSTMDRKTAVEV